MTDHSIAFGYMCDRRSKVAEDVTFRFERGLHASAPLSPLPLLQEREEGARLADRLASCEDPGTFIAQLSEDERSMLEQHSRQQQVGVG